MKLYITGPVGSGKTTYARRLSAATGIPCFHLDEAVHVSDPASPSGNSKRPEKERYRIFYEAIDRPDFIVEDTGRVCFSEGMARADYVVLLEPPAAVRYSRLCLRWLKQRLGLEKSLYRPSFSMLRSMLRWARDYDTGKDNLKARSAAYRRVVLRSRRDLDAFEARLCRELSQATE